MVFCPNCNKQLQDGAQFCDGCGAQLQQPTVFCPNCGKQLAANATFCDACGTAMNQVVYNEPVAENYAQAYDYAAPEQQSPIQGLLSKLSFIPKKLIGLGVAAVALVLVLVILFSTVFTPKVNNHVLYLKDSQMFYTAVSRIKPFEVTENLADDVSDGALVGARSNLANATHVTADGKRIFFLDEIEDGEYELCYRYLNKEKKDAEKIDSNVKQYYVDKSGKKVIYLTNEGKLYSHNLKDREKIDSDVSSFAVSKNGKKVVFFTKDEDLYIKDGKKDKEKIEGNIDYLCYVSEDFKTFYYVKKGNLYKQKLGKDKEKIDNDIDNVIAIYESGEIYYTKDLDNEEVTLMDYVKDDMAEADSKLEQPKYPYWSDFYYEYDDYDEARAAYDAAYDKYEEDREVWWEKQDRDDLRERLEEETVEVETATLCYYNGKKTTELSKNYSSYSTYASEKAVFIYSTLDKGAGSKVKLSEVEDYWDVRDMVEEALDESGKKHLAVKGKTSELDIDDASYFDISKDGKTVFFMKDIEYGEDDEDEEEPCGDLYKMTISGNKAKKAEKYDSDVYIYSSYFTESGKYLYFKDCKDNHADLCLDKKKIESDVYIYDIYTISGTKKFVFFTDYESKDSAGTLNIFDGSKSKKIADDVYDYVVTAKGQVAYLSDYDKEKYEGDLFLYKGSKPKKIDDEVMALIQPNVDEEISNHYIYLNNYNDGVAVKDEY